MQQLNNGKEFDFWKKKTKKMKSNKMKLIEKLWTDQIHSAEFAAEKGA